MYGYRAWCPSTGLDFCFGFVAITPLLFEDFTGKYHILLALNEVHVHAKDERNYLNSFRVMTKNMTLVRVLVPGLYSR